MTSTMQLQMQGELLTLPELNELEESAIQFLSKDDKPAIAVRKFLASTLAHGLDEQKLDTVRFFNILVTLMGRNTTLETRTPPAFPMAFGFESAKQAFMSVNPPSRLGATIFASMKLGNQPPTTVNLESGEIKELADGVFVKKTEKGTLELYVSQQ